MIKETITYTDFNGNERTEDFYFHMTEAELADWELSVEGGLSAKIIAAMKSSEINETIKIYKEILIKAYGEKSPDGRRFIKNDEVRDNFVQTQAFSDLYMKLATDSDAAAEFINGIMPKIEGLSKEDIDAIVKSTDSIDELIEKLSKNA